MDAVLEHRLLHSHSVSLIRSEKGANHMLGRRAYSIDSCYVAFAVSGRRPWVRSWWPWLWERQRPGAGTQARP
jgi:hypothetical protein